MADKLQVCYEALNNFVLIIRPLKTGDLLKRSVIHTPINNRIFFKRFCAIFSHEVENAACE